MPSVAVDFSRRMIHAHGFHRCSSTISSSRGGMALIRKSSVNARNTNRMVTAQHDRAAPAARTSDASFNIGMAFDCAHNISRRQYQQCGPTQQEGDCPHTSSTSMTKKKIRTRFANLAGQSACQLGIFQNERSPKTAKSHRLPNLTIFR